MQTLRLILGVFALSVLLAACDETTIDPFRNDGRYFTIYGYLDALETEHKVRVVPISRLSATITKPSDAQADIDAVVTSEESLAGQVTATHRWSHTLEQLEDETWGHVFTSNFIVRPNYTYTLRVTRSDGTETFASTKVPFINAGQILTRGPFQVNADSTEIRQEIIAPPIIDNPWAIRVVYLFSGGVVNAREIVPYGRVGERTDEGGWRFEIDAVADKVFVDAAIERSREIGQVEPGEPVFLTAMGVEYRLLDDNWLPPDDVFDAAVLDQPGTLSNVENGYGFFGSVGFFREEWNVEPFSQLLGYD